MSAKNVDMNGNLENDREHNLVPFLTNSPKD